MMKRKPIALLLTIVYFVVILNYDCLSAKASVINSNLRPVGTGVVFKDGAGEKDNYKPSAEYQKIEYKNGIFQKFETGKEKKEREKIRSKVKNFSFFLAALAAVFFLAYYISILITGNSLLTHYISAFNAHKYIVGGITASLLGAASELTGLYFSDNLASRHKLIGRFASNFLFKFLIAGPTASWTDSTIESTMPRVTATSFILAARAASSLTQGVGMTSLQQILITYIYQRSYANQLALEGDSLETKETSEHYTIARLIHKTAQAVWARLAIVFVQHDIIQTILANQPAYQMLFRYGSGYVLICFASWVVNQKKPTFQLRIFAFAGYAASIISFAWGNKIIGILAATISTVVYLFGKGKTPDRTKKLCILLNKAKKLLKNFDSKYVRVATALPKNIIKVTGEDGEITIVLNEDYTNRLLELDDVELAARQLSGELNQIASDIFYDNQSERMLRRALITGSGQKEPGDGNQKASSAGDNVGKNIESDYMLKTLSAAA